MVQGYRGIPPIGDRRPSRTRKGRAPFRPGVRRREESGLRPPADDGSARRTYRGRMAARPATNAWVLALAVGAFQVVGSFGAADNQPDRRAIDAVALGLVVVGPIALAWRNRRPLVAAAVAITAADLYVARGYPFGPIFVSVAVALYATVQSAPRRAVWWLAMAGFGGFVAAAFIDPRAAGGPGAVHLALVGGWLAMVLAVSEVARVRREQVVQRDRAAGEERLRRQGEQRLGLARELHDVLGHTISLINVQASVALHLLDEQPERARPALTTIKEASREALHELRATLDLLRHGEDAPHAPAPRLSALPTLVDAVRASGLAVSFEHEGGEVQLPAAVELAAYRIVQEALTNVTRHARASAAIVRVAVAGGDGPGAQLTVEVTDDGIGGTGMPGNGIVGMRERAAALGGTVEAEPCPGGGFRVSARLPVEP